MAIHRSIFENGNFVSNMNSRLRVFVVIGVLFFSAFPANAIQINSTGGPNESLCNQQVSDNTNVSVTRLSNGDCVIEFKNVGTTTWTVPTGVTSARILVVGGGGGGGAHVGGGGGGGGVIEIQNYAISPSSEISVTVGSGGIGAKLFEGECINPTSGITGDVKSGTGNLCNDNTKSRRSGNGQNSSFGSISAIGGGGGGSWDYFYPRSGGSGGGNSSSSTSVATGMSGQGNNGGSYSERYAAGGGGGAGSLGQSGASNLNKSGDGGQGLSTNINGVGILLVGGGGGGGQHGQYPPVSGSDSNGYQPGVGSHGGGNGRAATNLKAFNGIPNTGGGGGGSGNDNNSSSEGGDGGSGIVILRFSPGTTGGSGTVSPTPISSEPSFTTNGNILTYKFPATMDGGTLGCGRGQIGANESLMRLEYGGPEWRGDQCYDLFYVYYGDYRNTLSTYTANQIISAKQVFTWNSGTIVRPKSVISGLVDAQWSESTVLYNSRPAFGSFYDSTLTSIDGMVLGSQINVNSLDFVKEHFDGRANYGFTLRRSSGTPTREEGVGEGAPRIHTRDSSNPAYRPYLEVVIDKSRPAFQAPTDPPQGVVLNPTSGSLSVTWTSTPANTEQVVVEFNCSISGQLRIKSAASSKVATRNNLQTNEQCTVRTQSLNSGGSSPFSMSTGSVTIKGSIPSAGPNLILTATGSDVKVALNSQVTGATEYLITLSCSLSGQRTGNIVSPNSTYTFTGLRVGENCSAYGNAKNNWGTSSNGVVTNSVVIQGAVPTNISFVAESKQIGQLTISWNMIPSGATSIDASLACSSSGSVRNSGDINSMSLTFFNLAGGESCTPTLSTSNQYGSSIPSKLSTVKILAAVLDRPTITSVDVSTPTKATIRWTSPSAATSLDFIVKCPGSADYNFTSDAKYSGTTLSEGGPGETCSITGRSRNSTTTSQYSAPYTFTFKGAPPSTSPQGLSIAASSNQVEVKWNSAPNGTNVVINLFCSKSGEQRITTSAEARRYVFKAITGDNCYAALTSANTWGSSSVVNTNYVALKSGAAKLPSTPSKAPIKKPAQPKTELICVSGTKQKTILAVSPQCPKGWVKKPKITKQ